jgi:uncharacterized RDD family membrane protein YckC
MNDFKYQTFRPRFFAGLVDGLVFFPLAIANNWIYTSNVPPSLRTVWFVAYSLSFIVYSVALHARFGQTLGKIVTRVKVLAVSETKLSMKEALLRDAVRIVLTLVGVALDPPKVLSRANPLQLPEFDAATWLQMCASRGWFVAELVTMLANTKRRALHDLIAGSVVVRVGIVGSMVRHDAMGG